MLVVFGSIDDSLETKEKTISSSVICLQSQLGITDIQYRSYNRWILHCHYIYVAANSLVFVCGYVPLCSH